MLLDLMGQTARVLRPAKVADGFGDLQDSWGVTPVGYYPCRLQHAATRMGAARDSNMRDITGGRWVLYLNADADIRERDRVVVEGSGEFEVLSVYPVFHPRTGLHHFAVSLDTTNLTVAADG